MRHILTAWQEKHKLVDAEENISVVTTTSAVHLKMTQTAKSPSKTMCHTQEGLNHYFWRLTRQNGFLENMGNIEGISSVMYGYTTCQLKTYGLCMAEAGNGWSTQQAEGFWERARLERIGQQDVRKMDARCVSPGSQARGRM